jgi:hypothetical protein
MNRFRGTEADEANVENAKNAEYKSVCFTKLSQRSFIKRIGDEDEYNEYITQNPSAVESIGRAGQKIRPVYDLDAYGEKIDIEAFVANIKEIYPDKEVYYAKREPRLVKDKGMKYSFRVYVKGVITTSKQILKRLNDKNLKDDWECLDLSIYNKNHTLHTPLTTQKISKKKDGCICIDSTPISPLLPVNCGIFDCCASYIEEDWDEDLETEEPPPIPVIKNEVVANHEIPTPVISAETLKLHLTKLSDKRATDYDTWTKMLWCIINLGMNNNISRTKIGELCQVFSKLSVSKYNEVDTEKFVNDNFDNLKEASYGWKYLNRCLKEDNLQYYNTINILTYAEMKEDFEKTHAKILYPPMVVYPNKNNWEYNNFKKIRETYAHKTCKIFKPADDDGNKKDKWVNVSFINEWLKDPCIRRYNNFVFKPPPQKVIEDDFNTWIDIDINLVIKGMPCYDDNRNYWEEYKVFLNNLLGCEKVVNYILARYAMRLQQPAIRSFVIVIYCGTEGDGKNRALEPIYKIFGKYGFALGDTKQLYDKHSDYEENRLFLRLDEAGGVENFTSADVLKAKATEPTLSLNKKGIQAITIDNYCDYDMTTNNRNVVKLTDDSTRRFFQVETTPHYQGNIAFFNDYIKYIEGNGTAIKQIYEGLMAFDWKAVVISENFQDEKYKPLTKITQEVKEMNREKEVSFLEDYIRPIIKYQGDTIVFVEGSYKDACITSDGDDGQLKISSNSVFKQYRNWCESNKYKDDRNSKQFGMKFSKIIQRICPDCKKDTARNYLINLKSLIKYFETIDISFKTAVFINDDDDDE